MKLLSEATNSDEGTVMVRATGRSLLRSRRGAAGPDGGALTMTTAYECLLSSGDRVLLVLGPGALYSPMASGAWESVDWDERKFAAIEYLNESGDPQAYRDRLAVRAVLPWVRLHQQRRATEDRPSYRRLYVAMTHVLRGGDTASFGDAEAIAFVLPLIREAV